MDLHSLAEIPQQPAERNWAMVATCTVIALFCIGAGVFAYLVITRDNETHARFMRQYMEDHEEYECIALWRAGSKPVSNVVLLPVPLLR